MENTSIKHDSDTALWVATTRAEETERLMLSSKIRWHLEWSESEGQNRRVNSLLQSIRLVLLARIRHYLCCDQ